MTDAFGLAPRLPYPADLYSGCPCYACDQAPEIARREALGGFPYPTRMSLCPTCGNKRCPGAVDHTRWECGGSNEPGQVARPVSTQT